MMEMMKMDCSLTLVKSGGGFFPRHRLDRAHTALRVFVRRLDLASSLYQTGGREDGGGGQAESRCYHMMQQKLPPLTGRDSLLQRWKNSTVQHIVSALSVVSSDVPQRPHRLKDTYTHHAWNTHTPPETPAETHTQTKSSALQLSPVCDLSPAPARPRTQSWAVQWKWEQLPFQSPPWCAGRFQRRCWSEPTQLQTEADTSTHGLNAGGLIGSSIWYLWYSRCFSGLTCSVQFSLLFRNSTNRFTTPGVEMTSSIGGLGSAHINTAHRWKKNLCLCMSARPFLTLLCHKFGAQTFGEQLPEFLCSYKLLVSVFREDHLDHVRSYNSLLQRGHLL